MMQGSELPLLNDWYNFYMIIGTAAATLTGLMFVVTTLVVGLDRQVDSIDAGISAFNTPTIVHFCTVLVMAGILSAPWQALSSVRVVLGLLGLGMVFYLIIVWRRMRRVSHYQTPLKDWLWYMAFPLIVYSVIMVAAMVLPTSPARVLYLIGAAMVTLLLLGIRNAWDLVTFLALVRAGSENRGSE
jgi:hypothetical protein